MNKEEIIKRFVNSDDFSVIEEYISKPYEDTIVEIDNENTKLKQALNEIEQLLTEPTLEAIWKIPRCITIIDKVLGVEK